MRMPFKVEGFACGTCDGGSLIKGLYLAAQTGMTIGVVGANGSGKSSFYDALAFGTESAGSVFWNGHYVNAKWRRKNIAYLPQDSLLPGHITVGKILRIMGRGNAPNLTEDPLIKPLRGEKVGTLSGGERKYLEFMLVNEIDRPVVILDEPFAGIDPIHEERMVGMITNGNDSRIYLVTDHRPRTLETLCDEFLLLQGGTSYPAKDATRLRELGFLPSDFPQSLIE